MTPAPTELPPARRALAALLGFLILFVGLVSVSPQLHGCIHHDSHEAGHNCAATLFAHGVTTPSPAPVLAAPMEIGIAVADKVPPAPIWSAPSLRLPPACGPPRR